MGKEVRDWGREEVVGEGGLKGLGDSVHVKMLHVIPACTCVYMCVHVL